MSIVRTALLTSALVTAALPAAAANCDKVTFADVGWTDITATTAVATTVLQALGYDTEIKLLALPVTFASLANGQIDAFLGLWMPSMEADIAPYRQAGTIDEVRTNLTGAKYTLATNAAGAAAGIKDFKDIATQADLLDAEWNRAYSRETGAFPSAAQKAWKYWPAVNRVDNVYGDRNFVCSCPPIEDYIGA